MMGGAVLLIFEERTMTDPLKQAFSSAKSEREARLEAEKESLHEAALQRAEHVVYAVDHEKIVLGDLWAKLGQAQLEVAGVPYAIVTEFKWFEKRTAQNLMPDLQSSLTFGRTGTAKTRRQPYHVYVAVNFDPSRSVPHCVSMTLSATRISGAPGTPFAKGLTSVKAVLEEIGKFLGKEAVDVMAESAL
jgi:hypothetical protein